MWQYYVMSDYFVNLWDREIFGMAITEAIYYMVPSFLISAPGPRVIAAEMDNAFICSSIEEIADKISSYERDENSLRKDHRHLTETFTWDRFVMNVEEQPGQ